MPQELIVNVLGAASVDALCNLTTCISAHDCNILDSRHALYGTDFSLTMILSGTTINVTLLEMALSGLCMERDLLCMMKRTSGHQKQNIERHIRLQFSGQDSYGLMQKVTSSIASSGLTISAVRQRASNALPQKGLREKTTSDDKQEISRTLCSDRNQLNTEQVQYNKMQRTETISDLGCSEGQYHGSSHVVCKMILSAPQDLDLTAFENEIKTLLHSLDLHGQISHNIPRENNEHIESW